MTRTLTVCLISLLIATGCRKKPEKPEITHGRLEYRIAYETDSAHRKLVDLLPHRMKLVFNQDSAINIMEGFHGYVQTEQYFLFPDKEMLNPAEDSQVFIPVHRKKRRTHVLL